MRILLIQRTGGNFNDVKTFFQGEKSEHYIKETVYGDGKFLKLSTLTKSQIGSIQSNYASHTKTLRNSELTLLYRYLVRIDSEARPLYAIVLTDAYLEDANAVLQWSKKEDILNYIYEKEVRLIRASIVEQCGNEILFNAGLAILTMATMVGGMNIGKEFEKLLPHEYTLYKSKPELHDDFLDVSILFAEQEDTYFCNPVEPDIIGEYFVIKFFESIKKKSSAEQYINAAWGKPYFMSRFVNRLYQDFADLLELKSYKERFESVTIPTTVTKIDAEAFANCPNIKVVHMPDSVTHIGDSAFFECVNLEAIGMSEALVEIGDSAFKRCKSLKNIKLPSSLTLINDNTFARCENIETIAIPDSVISVGASAFSGCKRLKSIKLPKKLAVIGMAAFLSCEGLESIEMSDSIIDIGEGTFRGCIKLTSIQLPSTIMRVGSRAFQGCENLRLMEFPESINEIGSWAFKDCLSLESIVIRSTVINIANNAFENCASLQTAYVADRNLDISNISLATQVEIVFCNSKILHK